MIRLFITALVSASIFSNYSCFAAEADRKEFCTVKFKEDIAKKLQNPAENIECNETAKTINVKKADGTIQTYTFAFKNGRYVESSPPIPQESGGVCSRL